VVKTVSSFDRVGADLGHRVAARGDGDEQGREVSDEESGARATDAMSLTPSSEQLNIVRARVNYKF